MTTSPIRIGYRPLLTGALAANSTALVGVSRITFQMSTASLLSATRLQFEIKEGPFARTEIVDIEVVPLGNSLFAVSWQEKDGPSPTSRTTTRARCTLSPRCRVATSCG